MRNVIQMAVHQVTGVEKLITTSWDINLKGRWRPLQRVCWWLLCRTQAASPHFDERQVVRIVNIDTDQLVSAIVREAAEQLMRVNYHPTAVLLGMEDYCNLMGEPEMRRLCSPLCFDVPSKKYREFTVFGFRAIVIPWMRGVLVY